MQRHIDDAIRATGDYSHSTGTLDLETASYDVPVTDLTVHALFGMPVVEVPGSIAGTPAQTNPEVTQKLARLESLVASFSEVAHDLRHSLALIRGSSQLLMEPSNGDCQYYARLINEESTFLNRLMQDILDLSRLELGKFRLEASWADLTALVRATADAASMLTESHVILVNMPCAAPLIYADAAKLRQVLLNLLTNAIKHCPADGRITITVAYHEEPGSRIFVSVHNEGERIPDALRERLFERFETDALPDRAGRGTGLGLPICRGIVEAHGGQIWLESSDDDGTTFTFYLPCATATNMAGN